MRSELPPTGEPIRQATEALSTSIKWIAKLIVEKNWFTLLVLIAIANLFLLKPEGGIALEGLTMVLEISVLPNWYRTLFWTAQGVLILGALTIAIRTLPRATKNTPITIPDYRAIKGLRPFTYEDAEVFTHLQRQSCIRHCLESVTSPRFRFGILHGVSGCGKTSFLQAGIIPLLTAPDVSHRGIYVRFGGQDPLQLIASALSTSLEIPQEWLLPGEQSPKGFSKLLEIALQAAEKPLIIFLDQFEQFFVYYSREEQRYPFIQSLKEWYCDPQPLPVSFVVSVRSDLLYQLDELHKALGYALGPQEVFRLEKFTPTETVGVLKVIAQLEGLAFDSHFIAELAATELADRGDGRISPVDVQILAWMIEQQPQGELRAFDRNAFQKFGGVEGLLQRFLERTLEARMLSNQRQVALKVLLALTDLERQVRSGALTVNDLTHKLKGTVSREDVEEAVQWLAREDVRLITPHEWEGAIGYELAHERLIPALLRQTQKELTDVERARQLLDRRVNEWLGNDRDSRYLFSLREFWLIQKQRPYLDWGTRREQKEKLVRLSWRRIYKTIIVLFLLLSVTIGSVGWFRFSTPGQFQVLEWQLNAQLNTVNAGQANHAAVAFVKNNQWEKAFSLANKQLQFNPIEFANFIEQSADVLTKSVLSQERQSRLLNQLTERANSIQDDYPKSNALSSIASAHARLNEEEKAAELLTAAINSANSIEEDDYKYKFWALSDIAFTVVQLNEEEKAAELLTTVLSSANSIEEDDYKSSALSNIAAAAVQLNEEEKAAELLTTVLSSANSIEDDYSKSLALSNIASAYIQWNEDVNAAELLTAATSSADSIQNDYQRSYALYNIASAYIQWNEEEKAAELLAAAINSANSIQSDSSKFWVLSSIASAAVQLNEEEKAAELLTTVLSSANSIEDDYSKSWALSNIASAHFQLDEVKALEILNEALNSADSVQWDEPKSWALRDIASSAVQLNEEGKAVEMLTTVLNSADSIQLDDPKSNVLSAIAYLSWALEGTQENHSILDNIQETAQQGKHAPLIKLIASMHAKKGQWKQALSLLRGYGDVYIFSKLLTIQAESRNSALIDGAVVLEAAVVKGSSGNYTLEVKIQSPDLSCAHRAGWWEVITPEGDLLARQVLNQVHQEQQFTSQISSLQITADQNILIRAYFQEQYAYDEILQQSLTGYTDQALRGSIASGFKSVRIAPDFAAWLKTVEPQPEQCVE